MSNLIPIAKLVFSIASLLIAIALLFSVFVLGQPINFGDINIGPDGVSVGLKSLIWGADARTKISGHWTGEGSDISIPNITTNRPYDYKFDGDIKVSKSGRIVFNGFVKNYLKDTDKLIREYEIEGKGVLEGDYASLTYGLKGRKMNGIGSLTMNFLTAGDKAKGYFVGRDVDSPGMVIGYIELVR